MGPATNSVKTSRRTPSYWDAPGVPPDVALFQVVLLHVVAERPEAHTHQFGSLHLHPPGALECLSDVSALNFCDVRFQIEAGFRKCVHRLEISGYRSVATKRWRQTVGQDGWGRFGGNG